MIWAAYAFAAVVGIAIVVYLAVMILFVASAKWAQLLLGRAAVVVAIGAGVWGLLRLARSLALRFGLPYRAALRYLRLAIYVLAPVMLFVSFFSLGTEYGVYAFAAIGLLVGVLVVMLPGTAGLDPDLSEEAVVRKRRVCRRCGGPVRRDEMACATCGGREFSVAAPATRSGHR